MARKRDPTRHFNFTDRALRALVAGKTRYEVWDLDRNGFGLRVFPSGRKSWTFVFRFHGASERMTLGTFPDVGLAAARRLYNQAREKLAEGIHPKYERDPNDESPTIETLVDEYVERYAKLRLKRWKDQERMLRKDVLKHLSGRSASSIKRRDIVRVLDAIVDRGAPISARETLSVMRRTFAVGIERGLIEENPCDKVRPPALPQKRTRKLSDLEIRDFWRAIEFTSARPSTRLALRFMLVTGQREGEVLALEWGEIDSRKRRWTIPSTKTKNRRTHIVPLSSLARELLSKAHELGEKRWVFPSPVKPGAHLSASALDTTVKRIWKKLGWERFTPHDLRRTASTKLGELKVPRLINSKVLNHQDPSVTGIYDRHDYEDEKRQALEDWATELRRILGDE